MPRTVAIAPMAREPRAVVASHERSGPTRLARRTVEPAGRPDDGRYRITGTYLAWLRMGLALAALGVAAERVLPAEGIIWAMQLIAGVLTAGSARWRWQTVDRAMRAERPIPQPILGYVVAAIVVLDGLATIVLLLRADAG